MGLTISRADSAAPAPAGLVPPSVYGQKPGASTADVVNYLRLPQPVRYDELTREAYMALKPELFEGFRFDLTKAFNQNFAIAHSIFMGNFEVPTQNQQVVKMPLGTYEFGANLIGSDGNLIVGRISNEGRLSGTIKYDVTPWLSLKPQLQLSPEKDMSQAILDANLTGADWNGQLKFGSNQFYGCNYFQSVTPSLALGGEGFWWGSQMRSGLALAARHATSSHIATAQLASTGLVSLTYVQKLNEKISLASELTWNFRQREANAAFGYDCMLRQCRLRGRVDTDGKVAAYLEERINAGVTFLLSAEIDQLRKDYKFGFGMTVE